MWAYCDLFACSAYCSRTATGRRFLTVKFDLKYSCTIRNVIGCKLWCAKQAQSEESQWLRRCIAPRYDGFVPSMLIAFCTLNLSDAVFREMLGTRSTQNQNLKILHCGSRLSNGHIAFPMINGTWTIPPRKPSQAGLSVVRILLKTMINSETRKVMTAIRGLKYQPQCLACWIKRVDTPYAVYCLNKLLKDTAFTSKLRLLCCWWMLCSLPQLVQRWLFVYYFAQTLVVFRLCTQLTLPYLKLWSRVTNLGVTRIM